MLKNEEMTTITVDVDEEIIKELKKKYLLKTKREVMLFINGYIVGYFTGQTGDMKVKKSLEDYSNA